MIPVLFWTLTVLCCGYAALFGRRDGVVAAGIMFAGVALTNVADDMHRDWGATNLPVMAVDVLVGAALTPLAFRSRSFWPMWMTTAQWLAVVTHVASFFASGFSQLVYASLAGFWGIPCLASMVVGVTLDRRARVRARAERLPRPAG